LASIKEELINKTIQEMKISVDKSFSELKIKKPKNSKAIHKKFECNGCGMFPIIGARYHCTVCYDFDFCENCEEECGDEHNHAMTKFRNECSLKNFEFGSEGNYFVDLIKGKI